MSIPTANSRQSLRLQIASRIRRKIALGGLTPGDSLPTYRQLCKEYGVSLMTVRRAMQVLADEGIVRGFPGKGTFVAQEATILGRKLAQVGLVFYGDRSTLFTRQYLSEILRGILGKTDGLRVDVRIMSLRREAERAWPADVANSGVDGVILLGVVNEAYIADMTRQSLPVVVVDYVPEAVKLDCVACENRQAARQVVDHLVELGHKRIDYVDGRAADPMVGWEQIIETSDIRERREGYEEAMRAHRLVPRSHVHGGRAQGSHGHERWLHSIAQSVAAESNRATALVTYDTHTAALIGGAFAELGLRVPKDLSVAAVAGCQAESIPPDGVITYNRMDFLEMGEQAVRLLQKRLEEKNTEGTVTRIGGTLILGGTTAPPPAQ
ncbi:MAG TPA: GntR family transcriptional regulator [Phycisphaerae bacterium]|nr:GntR family transcriptional regulator [Phycisphaerae bacterium]